MFPFLSILSLKLPQEMQIFGGFFDSKMFVMSYCIIFSFNKALSYNKIVIFRSFQHSANQVYDISHFKQEHLPFFDYVTPRQLEDPASAVLFREKMQFTC